MQADCDFLEKLSASEIESIVDYCPLFGLEDKLEYFFNFITTIYSTDEKCISDTVDCSLFLYGVPNTGKTTLTYNIFWKLKKELNRDFEYFRLNISQLIEAELGKTAQNIQIAFQELINSDTPVFLVIDEIDQLCMSRTKENEHDAVRRAMSALMLEMDKFKLVHNRHVIVGITNIPEQIDAAILRRFFIKEKIAYDMNVSVFSEAIKHFLAFYEIDLISDSTISSVFAELSSKSLAIGDIKDIIARVAVESLFLTNEDVECNFIRYFKQHNSFDV